MIDIKHQIGNRITKSRKALGISIKELAARTEGALSAGRISNWEQCTRSPGPAEAKLLAEQLDVSASYLLCLTDNPQGELTASSKNYIKIIPVFTLKEALRAKELLHADAGRPVLFDDHEKAVVVDRFNKANSNADLYAVVVEDNSMQPDLSEGDLVIVDADRRPNPGDLVIAHVHTKNHNILRRYGESERSLFQLLASNELWSTVNVMQEGEATILGVVVEKRTYL